MVIGTLAPVGRPISAYSRPKLTPSRPSTVVVACSFRVLTSWLVRPAAVLGCDVVAPICAS